MLSRNADAVYRLRLETGCPKVPSRSTGRTVSDGSMQLGRLLGEFIYCAHRPAVTHIGPAMNKQYMQHRSEQAPLENHSRRVQSAESRYAAKMRGDREGGR